MGRYGKIEDSRVEWLEQGFRVQGVRVWDVRLRVPVLFNCLIVVLFSLLYGTLVVLLYYCCIVVVLLFYCYVVVLVNVSSKDVLHHLCHESFSGRSFHTLCQSICNPS